MCFESAGLDAEWKTIQRRGEQTRLASETDLDDRPYTTQPDPRLECRGFHPVRLADGCGEKATSPVRAHILGTTETLLGLPEQQEFW